MLAGDHLEALQPADFRQTLRADGSIPSQRPPRKPVRWDPGQRAGNGDSIGSVNGQADPSFRWLSNAQNPHEASGTNEIFSSSAAPVLALMPSVSTPVFQIHAARIRFDHDHPFRAGW